MNITRASIIIRRGAFEGHPSEWFPGALSQLSVTLIDDLMLSFDDGFTVYVPRSGECHISVYVDSPDIKKLQAWIDICARGCCCGASATLPVKLSVGFLDAMTAPTKLPEAVVDNIRAFAGVHLPNPLLRLVVPWKRRSEIGEALRRNLQLARDGWKLERS